MTTYNVSRETYDRLQLCLRELFEWQKKFNLVGKNSLPDAWTRHFEDSAQLFSLLPENAKTLADLGSGAGFPGIVLAVMALEKRPDLKITLIESIGKKTLFLKHLCQVAGCNNTAVLNCRAEKMVDRRFDVVTARAVTSLSGLLTYALPLLKKNGVCLFPKGKNHQEEINAAKADGWFFDCREVQSATDAEGVILVISNLSKKQEEMICRE